MKLTTVAISGFSSNAGKTSLMCELLRAFPGWEAIKMTRGHYRSCGKDPHACCVSHLLQSEPVIRSGRAQTYAPSNVRASGVFIEGTSFVNYLDVDLMLMCARPNGGKIKSSARRMMKKASALYLFDDGENDDVARAQFASWLEDSGESALVKGLPVYTRSQLPQLIERLRAVQRQ
jgi:hypothetical protein